MPLRNDTRMYIWHHMTPYDTIWHHKWHQDEGICREYRKSRIRSLTVAIGALKCWTPACSDLKNLQTLQWISCLILHQFNNWLQSNVHCRITDVQCFLMFSLYFVCRAIAHDVSPVEMFFQYVATDTAVQIQQRRSVLKATFDGQICQYCAGNTWLYNKSVFKHT